MSRYEPIRVTRGSCVDKAIRFLNGDRSAQDITDVVLSIADATPADLSGAILAKTDPANGEAHLHVPYEVVARLGMGNVNRFRISRLFLDGCVKTSPEIWICVL